MYISSHAAPVQFGKLARPNDLALLREQFSDEPIREKQAFTYAPTGGIKTVANPHELESDSLDLKIGLRAEKNTPTEDVYLILEKPNITARKVRKQVTNHFVKPFNAKGLSQVENGKRLDSTGMEITQVHGKTIVRVPFQRPTEENENASQESKRTTVVAPGYL